LGNDLVADDGVGIAVAEAVAPRIRGRAEVQTSSLHGLALLDELLGYERVILIDACRTGSRRPGTIFELTLADLSPVVVPSPHYSGLPEMFAMAALLGLDFPKDVRILAVEAADLETVGGSMTPAVRATIPSLCTRILQLLS
jgi:hydrogenase maturation protease